MPVFHVVSEALRLAEAAGWCVVLMGGGVVVGWLRWGMR